MRKKITCGHYTGGVKRRAYYLLRAHLSLHNRIIIVLERHQIALAHFVLNTDGEDTRHNLQFANSRGRPPMMPLGDDDSARRTLPVVTYVLIAINVLVFVLLELPNPNLDEFINRWGTVPAEIMAGRGLLTLLTSMFLHGGWAHLGGNMLFLWIFGDNVEDAFGHVLYLIFYLVTGLAASMAQVLLDPSSTVPGVGASGAISGVLAGYIVMFGSNRVRVLMGGVLTTVPAYVMIGLWIVVQFLNGFASIANTAQTDGVAYGAHVGGFIAGLVLTFLLRGFTRQRALERYDPVARSCADRSRTMLYE